MGKRDKLADEAQQDLDRIFPGTRSARKPVYLNGTGHPPLVPVEEYVKEKVTKRRG